MPLCYFPNSRTLYVFMHWIISLSFTSKQNSLRQGCFTMTHLWDMGDWTFWNRHNDRHEDYPDLELLFFNDYSCTVKKQWSHWNVSIRTFVLLSLCNVTRLVVDLNYSQLWSISCWGCVFDMIHTKLCWWVIILFWFGGKIKCTLLSLAGVQEFVAPTWLPLTVGHSASQLQNISWSDWVLHEHSRDFPGTIQTF